MGEGNLRPMHAGTTRDQSTLADPRISLVHTSRDQQCCRYFSLLEKTGGKFFYLPHRDLYDADRSNQGIPDTMSFPRWILFGLAVFLVADAVLAIVYGRAYMMLGLKYMPSIYRDFITRVSMLPRVTLLWIKIGECTAGLILFLVALSMK
jgi:hypothetical protein